MSPRRGSGFYRVRRFYKDAAPTALAVPSPRFALKVYVILTTGNEAGSAAMIVQRPANVLPLAA